MESPKPRDTTSSRRERSSRSQLILVRLASQFICFSVSPWACLSQSLFCACSSDDSTQLRNGQRDGLALGVAARRRRDRDRVVARRAFRSPALAWLAAACGQQQQQRKEQHTGINIPRMRRRRRSPPTPTPSRRQSRNAATRSHRNAASANSRWASVLAEPWWGYSTWTTRALQRHRVVGEVARSPVRQTPYTPAKCSLSRRDAA